MRYRLTHSFLALAMAAAALTVTSPVYSQEPRLQGRVPEEIRAEIEILLDSAKARGIPTEPLVDRALEGATKGASAGLILAAVRRLDDELLEAREALGPASSGPEIVAGASALRAGADADDLEALRMLRVNQSLTIAAAVLADLVAVGVPADTAAAAVIALAGGAEDVEYIAFRRNVERDISLGASPVSALGVRLNSAVEGRADFAPGAGSERRRPRKP